MRLDRYIAKSRIIDIKSKQLPDAFGELLDACPSVLPEKQSSAKLLKSLLEREKTMTTYLGNGVALPHVKLPMKRPYIFALGRCPEGLEYEGMVEYEEIRLIFLLLASDKEKSYLNVLASLARLFQDTAVISRLVETPDLKTFREESIQAFGGVATRSEPKNNKFNRLILKEAEKVAKGAECSSILIFGDAFSGGVELPHDFSQFKTILVTQSSTEVSQGEHAINDVITVRSFSNARLSQLRSAVLIGLTRGIIKYNEKICCVSGIAQSNQFDTLVVVDVEREFEAVFTKQRNMLPAGVKPEVLERILAIATELGLEGREGRPVGCLFVLGQAESLKPFTKPLVLNPFFGYKEEDRNILNPFMDETVKEFSSIDGAFIIRGDGVLEAAGSLIHAPDFHQEMPSGLGTRHAAAAAISMATDCIAITVSASSGQVTLFRRGQMLPLIEKSVERTF